MPERSLEDLESEVKATRARIDATLGALRRRTGVSAEGLDLPLDRGLDLLAEAWSAARRHPVPAALLGGGLLWLAAGDLDARRRRDPPSPEETPGPRDRRDGRAGRGLDPALAGLLGLGLGVALAALIRRRSS